MGNCFLSSSPSCNSCRILLLVAVVSFSLEPVTSVMLPPRLSANVTEVRVKEGQSGVVLQCSLDVGDDPISYKWLKNYNWVTASLGFAYRGYKKLFLSLNEIKLHHNGVYICEASNSAGYNSQSINVIVESNLMTRMKINEVPLGTEEILSEVAASLSDVVLEGDCRCDMMFLLHASPDIPDTAVSAQANLVHTIAETMISELVRISIMTYSDYGNTILPFGQGTNQCALRAAFRDLTHKKWPTRLQPVLREVFKKFKKSKGDCKVLFLPIFSSVGSEGPDIIGAQQLKKAGVKIFTLEVTQELIPGVANMSSTRGDGHPYHWHLPLKIWPTLVNYMKYMVEELTGCGDEQLDVEGVCVGEGGSCQDDTQCRGAGMGCNESKCVSLQCNINTKTPGCCSEPGDFWCGDVTRNCTAQATLCDGRVQCMNGADEQGCASQYRLEIENSMPLDSRSLKNNQVLRPCPDDKIARCQSSTLCLSLYDLCDGTPHCPEAEDEDPRFCGSFPCPVDRPFRCRDGKCLSNNHLCDGAFKNCEDGEDEDLDFCSRIHTCPRNQPFKCDYGVCITENMICNGAYNCLDASDELRCSEQSCPADRPFKCNTGICIDLALICNGHIDGCEDGSDEINCTTFECPVERSFKCQNGRCIDSWVRCNRQDDCGDNSDEIDCDYHARKPTYSMPTEIMCSMDEFQCISGACLSLNKICDGRKNCIGGDDEQNCTAFQCPADRDFKCTSGTCISHLSVCDNVQDCDDSSDERDCKVVPDYDHETDTKDTTMGPSTEVVKKVDVPETTTATTTTTGKTTKERPAEETKIENDISGEDPYIPTLLDDDVELNVEDDSNDVVDDDVNNKGNNNVKGSPMESAASSKDHGNKANSLEGSQIGIVFSSMLIVANYIILR